MDLSNIAQILIHNKTQITLQTKNTIVDKTVINVTKGPNAVNNAEKQFIAIEQALRLNEIECLNRRFYTRCSWLNFQKKKETSCLKNLAKHNTI